MPHALPIFELGCVTVGVSRRLLGRPRQTLRSRI